MQGRGRGRGGRPQPHATTRHDPVVEAKLHQLADEIGSAGCTLHSFLQLWVERFGSTLQAADYSEFSVQNIISKHSQGQLLVISKRQPGHQLPEQYVLPKPTKQQLENAVRKVQEQLHAQGLSVTLGSLDCALAQAFGLTGCLSDLGYQPRDLALIQDLLAVERNVSVLIATFLRARQVCTLADLDAYLAQQHKVDSYDDLCMGPLLVHELVIANFRPPEHLVEIPKVYMTDVVDTIADLMEKRPRPRGGRQQQQEQGRVGWHDVRQRLELKFGAPFEDLCVRLPEGDKGMGIFITNMVLGWKSEREQHHARVKTLSLEKKMLAGKCTAELHEVAQNMVLGHARTLQGLVTERLQVLQAAANRAVAVFTKDESIVLHTQLVLQPLPLRKLQAALWQLQLPDSNAGPSNSSSVFSPTAAAATARRKVKVRKSKASMFDPNAVSKSEKWEAEIRELCSTALLKAAAITAADSEGILHVPNPGLSPALVDMEGLLEGSRLQSLKALFNNDVEHAASVVQVLLSRRQSKQLMSDKPAAEALAEWHAVAGADGVDGVVAGAFASVPPPPPQPPAHGLGGADAASVFPPGTGVVQPPPPSSRSFFPPPPFATLVDGSLAATAAAASAQDASGMHGSDAALSPVSPPRLQPAADAPDAVQLSPEQLTELLWELLDHWQDMLDQQQQDHECEQQQRQEQQELEEALQQIGLDPKDAQEEAKRTVEKRAKQQQQLEAGNEQLGLKAESRWWRQQELPAVFGSSSEDAGLQLEWVSNAAGELVDKLAGSTISDSRLKELLVGYWQHDALLQLLLHAVRVLVQHAGLLQARYGRQREQEQDAGQQPSEEEQGDEQARVVDAAEAEAVKRSVGLPELLSAVQELGRGASLHALWRLEVDLLKRFDVPSFQALQLPAGCSSLLSALAAQDELAAVLTGYADAWDCGAVAYEDVLRVVQQALGNLGHSIRSKSRRPPDGMVAKAVSAALCTHFHVPSVLRLGYGPAQGLIQSAQEDAGLSGAAAAAASTSTPSASDASAGTAGAAGGSSGGSVACWSALALTSTGASQFTAHASGLTPAHGLATLSAAPVLANLSAWSDWDTLYAPCLGPLPAFLSKHQRALGFQVLEVPGGGLLRLPAAHAGGKLDLQQLRAGWKLALEQDRPEELVGLLLLHITEQGGLAAAHDLVMLGDLLASLLAADLSKHQGGTSSSGSRSWMQAVGAEPYLTADAAMRQLQGLSAVQQKVLLFIVQCLQLLPVPVAPSVAGEVLIRPLGHVLAWEPEVVHWALLVAAAAAELPQPAVAPRVGTAAAATWAMLRGLSAKGSLVGARQRLHALGFTQLGVASWQDDCMGSVAGRIATQQAVKQQQVLAATATATATAGTAAAAVGIPVAAAGTAAGQQPSAASAGIEESVAGDGQDTVTATPNSASSEPPNAAAGASTATPAAAAAATTPAAQSAEEASAQDSSTTALQASSQDAPSAPATEQEPVIVDLGEISDPCQRLIEERRRLRGVGMNLQGEAAAFAKAQIRTIGNAIKKLSSELYTKDVHFIMELVQNADDNSYTATAGLPVLELVTSFSSVTCLNNEVGFSPDDVEGICEVGGSKKQGKAGFTGQKGIGFKAVFRVTNCPQIHSRGFHFAFDLEQHPEMGYVLPTWVGNNRLQPTLLESLQNSVLARLLQQQRQELLTEPDAAAEGEGDNGAAAVPAATADAATMTAGFALSKLLGLSNMTLLHLPLKAGSEDVGQKLAQLRPTLLLFLRQLRCLVLSDAEAGTSKVMLRVEEPNSDFVRLLVRAVALPPAPPLQAAADASHSPTDTGDLGSALGSSQQQESADGGVQQVQEQQGNTPALSPAAVESLLSQSSGCEVLLQEESRWLVVSDTFSPGDILRLGYEVEATTVSLAFGIHEAQATQKEVFAFLPVRRYGLNFIVQGDFVVPSSRGDIDLDDPFNQLLHSKVPGLFASSFTKFKAMSPPEGQQQLYWMDWWLKCVPLPEHMHEFFASLPEEVASHLQALRCIPTEADDGGVGPWVPPGNALVCSSPHIKELVSAEQLARLQGKYFVHPSLTALCEPQSPLRRLLRIGEFDPQEVICLVRDMAAAGELSGHSIPQLRQLLVTVFGLLFGVGLAAGPTGTAPDGNSSALNFTLGSSSSSSGSIRVQSLLKELKECPLLPLYGRQGVLVPACAVSEGAGSTAETVFFPVDGLAVPAEGAAGCKASRSSRPHRPHSYGATDSTQSAAQLASAALKSCSITQQQLAGLDVPDGGTSGAGLLFVDPELLQLEDPQQRNIMVQGLKGLGVRELEPLDVVHGYVLPSLAHMAERCKQTAAPAAAAATAMAAAEAPPSSADGAGACSNAGDLQLDKAQQQHLMRLLAFPLAARLLDTELGVSSSWPPQPSQQQQALPNGAGSGRPGTLLSQIMHVAVLVTSTGSAVLAPCSTHSTAAASTATSTAGSAGAAGQQDEQCLFLPKQLGNVLDLPQLFPAHSWALVSHEYASCCSGINPQQWLTLMQVLGVQTFLPVRQQTVELTWKQLMMDKQYAAWKDAIDRMDDSVRYVFTDWHWRHLQALLSSIASDTNAVQRTEQYRRLSHVVARQWEALKASGYLYCSYNIQTVSSQAAGAAGSASGNQDHSSSMDGSTNQAQQRHKKKTAESGDSADSTKFKALSAAAASWQPGKQALPSSVLQGLRIWEWMLASDGKPHAPSELFVRQPDIQRLFSTHVLYIVVEDVSLDMALTLGATCNTSPETVLQVLTAWSVTAAAASSPPSAQSQALTRSAAAGAAAGSAAAADADESPAGFTSTLQDMAQLYHHLSQDLRQSELPRSGFMILQEPDRLASLPKSTVVRLQVSKAFNDAPLIWLPDTDEVLKAAAAHRAAESQRGYLDDDGFGMGGYSSAAGGALGGRLAGPLSSAKRGGRGGRGAGKAGSISRAAAQQGSMQNGGKKPGAGAAAEPVPDDVMYDGSLMGALLQTPMRGRFYSSDQLRFTDEAKIFEVTHPVLQQHFGSSASGSASLGGARPPPMLRVLGAYYGSQKRLFVELLQRFRYDTWIPLVGEYPTFGDYLRTLDGFITATGDKAQPTAPSYRMVSRVLSTWASGIVRGVITHIAQNRLYSELVGGRADKPWKVLPGRDGSWLSLADHPHIADDSELLGLFEDVRGITFLAQPGPEEGSQAEHDGRSARRATAVAAAGGSPADWGDLWYALQVPYLSQVVEPAPAFIQPPEPQQDRPLSVCLAAALPLLQRHLFSTLPRGEHKVLEAALGPRLAHLKVFAVTELARVYQLRGLNSDMAADGQVVSRDGASWVQRKQPCVALVDLASEDQEQEQEEGQVQPQEKSDEIVGGSRSGSGEAAADAADSSTEPEPSAAATGAESGAGAGDLSEQPIVAADADVGAKDSALGHDSGDSDHGSSGKADALYVVCPDNLIECCHQVSAEVSAYIGLLAEEAGCGALDVGGLTTLLEKLLMAQAMGGDVHQVMRQPPYSRYPDLPDGTQPWQLQVPPEPEPEPEPQPEPQSPTGSAAGSGSEAAAADEAGDAVDEAGEGVDAGDAAGQARKVGQLPELGLDLSDLLSAEPTEGSSALDAVHQWRLEHDAEVRAKMEAAAEKRAAQAAADAAKQLAEGGVVGGAADAAAGSSTAAAAAAAAAASAAAIPAPREHNPLVISSNIGPAIIPAVRRVDPAAVAAAAAAAAATPATQQSAAAGVVAAAAVSDYHQEVVVVVPQGSPAASPAPVLPPSLTSPDKIVVVPASQQGTPAAAAAGEQSGTPTAPVGGDDSAAAAAAGAGARRHLDMNAAAGAGVAAAEVAGAPVLAVATEGAAVQAAGQPAAMLGDVCGHMVLPAAAEGTGGAVPAGAAGAEAVGQYSLFPGAAAAAPAQDIAGAVAGPGQFSLFGGAAEAQMPTEVEAAAEATPADIPAGARMPQLVFMGLPTFSLLGPSHVALSLQAGPPPQAAAAAGQSLQRQVPQQLPMPGQKPIAPEFANQAMAGGGDGGGGYPPAGMPLPTHFPGGVAASSAAGQQSGMPGMPPMQALADSQQFVEPNQAGSSFPVNNAFSNPAAPPNLADAWTPQQLQRPQHPDFSGSGERFEPSSGSRGQQAAFLGPHAPSSTGGPAPWSVGAGGSHVGPPPHQQHGYTGAGGGAGAGVFSGAPGGAAGGLISPLRGQPTAVTSWHEAEGAARAAGLISAEVPLPHQVLVGLQTALPPAPQLAGEASAVTADVAAVGRFGEELAYLYYLQHPDAQPQQQLDAFGQPIVGVSQQGAQLAVEWVNQQQESWLPFDLILREAVTGAVLCYVEVKTSRDSVRQFFDMTQRELEFAAQQGDRYHILRIRGVSSGSPTLERLINPVNLWRQQAVRVCVVL